MIWTHLGGERQLPLFLPSHRSRAVLSGAVWPQPPEAEDDHDSTIPPFDAMDNVEVAHPALLGTARLMRAWAEGPAAQRDLLDVASLTYIPFADQRLPPRALRRVFYLFCDFVRNGCADTGARTLVRVEQELRALCTTYRADYPAPRSLGAHLVVGTLVDTQGHSYTACVAKPYGTAYHALSLIPLLLKRYANWWASYRLAHAPVLLPGPHWTPRLGDPTTAVGLYAVSEPGTALRGRAALHRRYTDDLAATGDALDNALRHLLRGAHTCD